MHRYAKIDFFQSISYFLMIRMNLTSTCSIMKLKLMKLIISRTKVIFNKINR